MKKRVMVGLLMLFAAAAGSQSYAHDNVIAVQRGGIVSHYYYAPHSAKQSALYQKAEEAALKGDFRSAISAANKYIQYYGETPEIYYLIGNIRSLQNDIDCAIDSYSTALRLAKTQPIIQSPYNDLYSDLQINFLRGTLKIKAGDYSGALADANTLINLGDNYFAAAGYILKAEIDFRNKNYLSFERNLNTAITAEPLAVQELIGRPLSIKHSHLAAFLTGYQNLNLGHYDASITYLNDALSKNRNFYLGYAYRGYAKTEAHDYYAAMKDLDKAISINPDASLAYYFRAYLNELMHNPKAAVKDYNTAVKKANIVYPYVENMFRLVDSRIVKADLSYPLYIPRPQYIPSPEYMKLHSAALPFYRRTIDGVLVY